MDWVDELATIARGHLEQWELRPDGEAITRSHSRVLPVRTSEGTHAVLKVSRADPDSENEHLVLRRWGGGGAVRLLRADPPHRVVLLERLICREVCQEGKVRRRRGATPTAPRCFLGESVW